MQANAWYRSMLHKMLIAVWRLASSNFRASMTCKGYINRRAPPPRERPPALTLPRKRALYAPPLHTIQATAIMAGSSDENLAQTNDPYLDQRVSIAFIVIDTFFLLLFYASRYFNKKAVGLPMLICNTVCYVLCLGSAVAGICGSFPCRLV